MQATEQITRTVERMSPGRAVVASLLAHGVDTVFGLDGSHVIQVFDALADAPSIAPLTFKHENNAAIAAEMYGRLTGRPGVVVVTAGPGATNSLSGIGGAYAAGAPVVHISGGVPVGAPHEAFHGVDGPEFIQDAFKGVTKWSTRVEDASEIPAALAKAFKIAVSGRPGPTHVEIAESALTVKEVEVEQAALVSGPTSVYDGADDLPNLDDLVSRIDGAARIAIVAGKNAMYQPVSEAIVKLAERLGAPVAHTWDGHGAMPTVHPLSMGVWWGAARSHPTALEVVGAADLVLGVGVRAGTEMGVGLLGGDGAGGAARRDRRRQPDHGAGDRVDRGARGGRREAGGFVQGPRDRTGDARHLQEGTRASAARPRHRAWSGTRTPGPGTSARRSTRWPGG